MDDLKIGQVRMGAILIHPDTQAAATPEETEHYQGLQTPEAMVATGALGLARTTTFGLSDALLRAVGADTERAKELQAANPGTNFLGETAGYVSPALLEAAGSAVERLGVKGAGEAGELIGKWATGPGLAGQAGEAVGNILKPNVGKLAEPEIDIAGQMLAAKEAAANVRKAAFERGKFSDR